MGPSSTQNAATQTEQQAAGGGLQGQQYNQQLEQQLINFANQQYQQGFALQQPLINQEQQLASGNRSEAIQAAGPQLGNIAKAGQSAQAQLMNSQPAGAGRDVLAGQIPLQTYSQSAGLLNNLIEQAPQQLAQIGTGRLSLASGATGQGLGAGGVATGAGGLAANTSANIVQQQQQQKAETLSFLGSLAGIGGGIATGGLFGGGGFGGFGGGNLNLPGDLTVGT